MKIDNYWRMCEVSYGEILSSITEEPGMTKYPDDGIIVKVNNSNT